MPAIGIARVSPFGKGPPQRIRAPTFYRRRFTGPWSQCRLPQTQRSSHGEFGTRAIVVKRQMRDDRPSEAAGLSPGEAQNNPAEASTPLSAASVAEGSAPAVAPSIKPGGQLRQADPSTHPVDSVGSAQPVAATLDDWGGEIGRATGNSVGWRLQTGQLRSCAKQDLPHGEWMAIFESRKLEFTLRTAERRAGANGP